MKTMPYPYEDKYIPEPNTGCYLWIGAMRANRYGGMTVGKTGKYAHRYAWELAFGPIPEGKCVCHKCDTPICVNPQHLFLGSRSDNMQDMLRKGRSNYRTPARLAALAKAREKSLRSRRTAP